ncbi:ribosome biogenesis NEP1-like protein [Parasponia andersonii]|uniref:Ribosome biogenesis NEP1-like protein n=1 Tax=Parasponia andersonii TaxID=3476 RepID=A0A2P5AGI5_PARAD|nr:ribosome biogenesis NEP1-like protein [Parasponia andersonii]
MALRATKYWRSVLTRMRSNRSFATSTAAKMKAFTPTVDAAAHSAESKFRGLAMKGEFAPIYMVMGMVVAAVTIATHTAKQQLLHSPAVNINKKKRETMPEVDDPDAVISSADNFVNKSFLRKVAHIQDADPTLSDPVRPNPFTRSRNAETLKTVGVDPSRH